MNRLTFLKTLAGLVAAPAVVVKALQASRTQLATNPKLTAAVLEKLQEQMRYTEWVKNPAWENAEYDVIFAGTPEFNAMMAEHEAYMNSPCAEGPLDPKQALHLVKDDNLLVGLKRFTCVG